MSFRRTQQLQDLQQIIQQMSKEIMWVNSREEEELVFDWGDKNIDQYIPQKQESYSVSKTYKVESSKVQEELGHNRNHFDILTLQKFIVHFKILRASF